MKRTIQSVQGRILSNLMADITSAHVIGKKIKSGEYRKRPIEPVWRCPKGYQLLKQYMGNYEMELLEPYNPKRSLVVLQLHGGGYIGPMKNIYRTFAVLYSKAADGASVATIDYRVAPENPYPAALEDAIHAYFWLLENGYSKEQIVVAGDSAGGGLALALCLYLRDECKPLPKGIITMSAWSDLTCEGESYTSNYEIDPLFGNTKDSMLFQSDYIGDNDAKNPYISPVFGEYHEFPPVLMQVGSAEMLLSDTLEVAQKIKEQGGKIRVSVYEGMFHVFQMSKFLIPESREAWKEVSFFFKSILNKL
ncbi:acetyl esterase/lipase [Lachnotalea glycerini]|uniref:Acetyl esterase/lipase n=1 Tax=Lachnotalea glycerini TaxID=1763509 RepID=A0A255IQS3_9FIRM|nr:alpha/beta hydrolase [Lachnotalea glycerini]PXV89114.1 acetyl esterase/lipase [Lachnotalea glycerini]RDY30496.1 alpha/beta hydrolase [Lachnotalea glycerini]